MNKLAQIANFPGTGKVIFMTFIPCGVWKSNKLYAYSSLVKQGDASYICINPDGSSASPQDLFISANNQILQLQNGSYVQASSDTHPDWQELCRDGVPGTTVDCATAEANGLMSSEDYKNLRDLLVSNESLLTQSEELQTLYDQLLEKVNSIPPAPVVNNGKTEFRLGEPKSFAHIGTAYANQSDDLIFYIPYASADKHGVLKSSDYVSLMNMLNAHPTIVNNIKQLTNKVSDCATKEYVHTYVGDGALHLKVNGTELTPEGGLFTANKSGDSTIDIAVPTAESIEDSTLTKLGDKVVFKDKFASELALEMAEVLSTKNTNKGLIFKFTNTDTNLECNPDILSVNYIKVGDYYRLNITGSFVLTGFDFAAQRGQVLYSVCSGSINNGELSTDKTGMLYLRLSELQASSSSAEGPVMFELSVFVKMLAIEGYSDGIWGYLSITQFYS